METNCEPPEKPSLSQAEPAQHLGSSLRDWHASSVPHTIEIESESEARRLDLDLLRSSNTDLRL